MRMLAKITICLILLLAVSVYSDDDAGRESVFSAGTGARALALGGGFVSLADDASAVYYNPAGIPSLQYMEISLMHMELFEGSNYDFAGWVYPDVKLGGFGFGYLRIGTDEIKGSEGFVYTEDFEYSQSEFIFSYGNRINSSLSYGANFKIINQTIKGMSDNGLGLDIGLLSSFNKYYSIGMVARDIVSAEIKLDSRSEDIPVSFSAGLGIKNYPFEKNIKLTASLELEKIEDRSTLLHTGAEMVFNDRYALRLGYDRDNFAFGAGLKHGKIKIDYAYKVLDYVEDIHRFSLSFLLGPSAGERNLSIQKQESIKGTELLEGERRRQFDLFASKAEYFYRHYQLDSSLVYYQRALAFDEDNSKIIGKIAAIEESIRIEETAQRDIEITRFEYTTLMTSFLTQAEKFFDKRYYPAALDMLDLVFEIDSEHNEAIRIKTDIEQAVSSEISQKLLAAQTSIDNADYRKAIESYSRVLELDPGNLTVKEALKNISSQIDIAQQLDRAVNMFNKGDYKGAGSAFGIVLTLDPDNSVALEYLKKISSAGVKQDDIRSTTLEELQKDKRIWKLYLDGLRYMRSKEYQKAIDAWNEVLKAYPSNIDTINNIEQAKLRMNAEQSE